MVLDLCNFLPYTHLPGADASLALVLQGHTASQSGLYMGSPSVTSYSL